MLFGNSGSRFRASVAISAAMDVDHGTVQPLQKLFGDATAKPVIPIFVNSVATPLGPLRRVRALGTAVGRHLATLGRRVLVIGSGGRSHDPPVPTLDQPATGAAGHSLSLTLIYYWDESCLRASRLSLGHTAMRLWTPT